jgi:hypothetical protein
MSAPGTNPEHPVEERIRLKTEDDCSVILSALMGSGIESHLWADFEKENFTPVEGGIFDSLIKSNRDFISYYRDKTKQWGKFAGLSRFIAGQLVVKLSEGATLLSKIAADSSDENKMAVHAYMELLTAFLVKHELAEVVKEDTTNGQ